MSNKLITLRVDEAVYEEFKSLAAKNKTTPTAMFRRFMDQAVVMDKIHSEEVFDKFFEAKKMFQKGEIAILLGYEENDLDTLSYRKYFDNTKEVSDKEKEYVLSIIEKALSHEESTSQAVKFFIDKKEFLGLKERGAYMPVVVKTFAGLMLMLKEEAIRDAEFFESAESIDMKEVDKVDFLD